MKRFLLALTAAAALWSAACGGGGSNVTPPPPTGNFSAASLNCQYAFVTSGVAEIEPGVKTSPLVTKAYWPFKLAALKLPVGGGGVTLEPPPPQAALQRAAAAVRAKRKRFIAHLAAPQFERATGQKRGSSRSLGCCERRRLACPFVRCERRKLCHCRKPDLLR